MNRILLPSVLSDQRRSTEAILRSMVGVSEWTYMPAAKDTRPTAFVVCPSEGAFADIVAELESVDVSVVRFSRLPRNSAGYVDVTLLRSAVGDVVDRAGASAHSVAPLAVLDGGPLDLPADYPMTLVAVLHRASRLPATHGITFVDSDGGIAFVSYNSLYHEARALAATLAPFGREGYRHVVICCANRIMFVRAFWACQFAAFTAVPCETEVVGTDPVRAVLNVLSPLGSALVLYGEAECSWVQDTRLTGRCSMLAIPTTASELPSETMVDFQLPKSGDWTLLLSTSGSTGAAKLIMQNDERLLGYAAGSIAAFGFGPDMVSLNWMPLTHVGGLVMYHLRDVLACCQQVIVDTNFILRRPCAWLELIDRYKVTNSWAPNFAYALVTEDLRNHPGLTVDLSSMEFLLNGGELISSAHATAFLAATERFGLRSTTMVPAWGMSETCSGVLYGSPSIPASGPVAVGKPLPGCAVRIVDDSGTTAMWGQIAELQVKGRPVMGGYFRRRDFNAESFTEDGWLRTGDLAKMDERGITICGRIKDTLIINGLNFSAAEIERAAESTAEIEPTFTAAVAIRGKADATDRILLLVVPRAGTHPDFATRAAKRAVEEVIGIRPTWIRAVDRFEIPKTLLGKIRRQEIQRTWQDRLEGHAVDAEVDVSIHVQRWQAFQLAPRPKQVNPTLFINAAPRSDLRVGNIENVRAVKTTEASELGIGDLVRVALEGVTDDGTAIELMIAVEPTGDPVPGDGQVYPLILQLRDVGTLLATHVTRSRFRLTVLFCETDSIDDLLWLEPAQALLRCLAAEYRGVETRAIRIAPGADLATVLRASFSPHELALKGNRTITRVICAPPAWVETNTSQHGSLYIVSGGLGEIGHRLSGRLIDQHGARLIIIGSSSNLPPLQQQRLEVLSKRTSVTYLNWDNPNTSARALREAITDERRALGSVKLGGIFHLAGKLAYGPLDRGFDDRFAQAWEAKASVAEVLLDVAHDYGGCRTVFFSSLTAQFGGANLGAHATANAYLDALCERANARGDAPVYSINWSVWAEIGQSAGRTDPDIARLKGFQPLSMDAGFAALDDILRRPPGTYLTGLKIDKPTIAWRAEAATVLLSAGDAADTNVLPKEGDECLAQLEPVILPGLFRKDTLQNDIAAIWSSVLNLDRITHDENFFDVGGTSLLVPQVLEGIRKRFDVRLKAVDIFRYPTIEALSVHVSRAMVTTE
jgi:acyl-CoA synthetase (AMP-forming)/AMP-acid ligase II/acyl carrier protein